MPLHHIVIGTIMVSPYWLTTSEISTVGSYLQTTNLHTTLPEDHFKQTIQLMQTAANVVTLYSISENLDCLHNLALKKRRLDQSLNS